MHGESETFVADASRKMGDASFERTSSTSFAPPGASDAHTNDGSAGASG